MDNRLDFISLCDEKGKKKKEGKYRRIESFLTPYILYT